MLSRQRGQLSSSPFFSPVWPSVPSVINHPVSPDMASRCCDTQSLCVCVSVLHLCLCAFLLCVFNSLAKNLHVCTCLLYVNNHVCSLLECLPVCWCVRGGKSHRQLGCVSVCDIYDTFYLFIVVLPPVTTSPRGNQASLMVLISDMSQMVCLSGKG